MRTDCAFNIILIGMPGAGKSTVGVLLAKRLGYNFVDTDLLIQAAQSQRLQQIIGEQGMTAFKQLEEEQLCKLATSHTVIATGGSAVYSRKAMDHLRRFGETVFLDIPLAELEQRVSDIDARGVVLDPGEDFAQLFNRRRSLYQTFADLTIDGSGMNAETIAAAIEQTACG